MPEQASQREPQGRTVGVATHVIPDAVPQRPLAGGGAILRRGFGRDACVEEGQPIPNDTASCRDRGRDLAEIPGVDSGRFGNANRREDFVPGPEARRIEQAVQLVCHDAVGLLKAVRLLKNG